MTPEGRVKAQVKSMLKRAGAYYHMPVQNGMGAPSLDFICCLEGRYFGIETKAGNKGPTERQENTMEQIRRAGGLAFLVNENPDTLVTLEVWIKIIKGM